VILNELRIPDTSGSGVGSSGSGVGAGFVAATPRRRELEMKRGSVLQSRHRPQLARTGLEPVGAQWFQQATGWFRRTHIPLRRDLIAAQGKAITHEVLDIVAEEVRVYPNPDPRHCSTCTYRAPCLAMLDGADPEPILAAGYRRRTRSIEEPRIGRGFGFVAPPHGMSSHGTPPRASTGAGGADTERAGGAGTAGTAGAGTAGTAGAGTEGRVTPEPA
ncbi:MAG: hypothetical protein ACRDX8_07700, partial [Acidimicrobiales bacterium]